MNLQKKFILQIISFIGLALSIIPAFLLFGGILAKDTYLQLMIVGMILWFSTAVFWIKPDHFGQ
ncbi:MAG: hypothetical protein ACYTEL_19035 [Planctomycetota bacterium]|jgi:hypothetical protein